MTNKNEKYEFAGATFKYDEKKNWVSLKLGNQKTRIKKSDLWMMVFMNTPDKKQKDDLIAEHEREMMQFVRQHQVRAARDIKAGEMVIFNCRVDIPLTIVESIVKKEGLDMDSIVTDNKLSTPTLLLDSPKGV